MQASTTLCRCQARVNGEASQETQPNILLKKGLLPSSLFLFLLLLKILCLDSCLNKDYEVEDKIINLKVKKSALTKEELAYFTNFFGKEICLSAIRKVFRNHFYPKNSPKVPHAELFASMMKRVKDHSTTHPSKTTGIEPLSMKTVEIVKNFYAENARSHSRECSNNLNLSMGTARKVLRTKVFTMKSL